MTEFGSHSTPKGPAKCSEQMQAQRVVRQALSLYAEDVRAFAPHVMGQREENETYHEDWFGFFRLNHEPKPVLLAYANCARLIDGLEYQGDLWLGPEVGAMVFGKKESEIVALFTKEGKKEISIQTRSEKVTLLDMVGNEKTMEVVNGTVNLTVNEDVCYLKGLDSQLIATASTELREDRWPQPEALGKSHRTGGLMATPTFDGNLADWQKATAIAMVNPKVNGNDASGIAFAGWNEEYLFIGLNMRDNQVMNEQVRGKLYRDDSMELFISTEPRDSNPGYGPNDHQFFVTPES